MHCQPIETNLISARRFPAPTAKSEPDEARTGEAKHRVACEARDRREPSPARWVAHDRFRRRSPSREARVSGGHGVQGRPIPPRPRMEAHRTGGNGPKSFAHR